MARRRAVTAIYAGLLGWILWGWWNTSGSRPAWLASRIFLAITLHFAGWFVLTSHRTGIWRITNDPDGAIDERQRAVRDRAYRSSYLVLSGLLIAAFGYGIVAVDWGLPRPRTHGALGLVVWTVVVLVTLLPTTVLAWSEPDPAADD